MKEALLNIWIDVETEKDVIDIVNDLKEILGDSGVTNSIKIVEIIDIDDKD